jgi:hypothetical protein
MGMEMEIQERFEKINGVQVGDFATYSVGSDCYVYQIVEVKRFKSGDKVGQAREFAAVVCDSKEDAVVGHTGGYGWDIRGAENFVARENGEVKFFSVRDNGIVRRKGADYGSFSFEIVREYRDPSF